MGSGYITPCVGNLTEQVLCDQGDNLHAEDGTLHNHHCENLKYYIIISINNVVLHCLTMKKLLKTASVIS
jgi:hypothetical protein